MWLWLVLACGEPELYDADADGSPATEDCDDADSSVFPGADERCNGIDDDCDGHVDEDSAIDATTWGQDADADGYGDPNEGARACEAPEGHVDDFSDCDDSDPAVHPDARELADGLDDDCDGEVDEDADPFASELAHATLMGLGEAGRYMGVADLNDDGLSDVLVGAEADDWAAVVLGPTQGEVDLDQAWLRIEDGAEGTGSALVGGYLNPDGYMDLVVGAHGLEGQGGAYVIHGPLGPGQLSLHHADALLLGTGGGAGHRVVLAGDTNGDGHQDLLLGERKHDGAFEDEGVAWLMAGPFEGTIDLSQQATASIHGAAEDDRAGRGLWAGADVNGDGLDDIAVAAPRDDSAAENAGLVGLFHGPISGELLLDDAHVRYTGEAEESRLGFDATGSLSSDLNGDGHLDLTLGDGEERSTVFVIYGPLDSDMAAAEAHGVVRGEPGDALGLGIAVDEDLDGDGSDDLLLGAHLGSRGLGAAYLFFGPVQGQVRSWQAAERIVGERLDDHLGYSLSWAPDYDGDGAPDIILGAFGRGGGATYILPGASL